MTALCQIRHIYPIDHVPQRLINHITHREQHGSGFRLCGSLGSGPETNLAGLGVGCQGGIGHKSHLFAEKFFYRTLTHSKCHNVKGNNHFMGQFPQIGLHMAAEHCLHLMRRAGKHQNMNAAAFEGTAGGRTYRIVKNRTALRQLRLLDVVFRHRDMKGSLIKRPDVLQYVRVENQRFAECRANGLLGEIIIGRPQTAGGDNDIRSAAGNVQRFFQTLGVVTYDGVPEHVDSQGREALRNHLGIGIGNIAKKQLRAHGNELSGMGHNSLLFFSLSGLFELRAESHPETVPLGSRLENAP